MTLPKRHTTTNTTLKNSNSLRSPSISLFKCFAVSQVQLYKMMMKNHDPNKVTTWLVDMFSFLLW